MKPRNANRRRLSVRSLLQWLRGFSHTRIFKALALVVLAGCIGLAGIFVYFYQQDSRTIDRFLDGELFQHTARLYARPYHIYPGQRLRADAVVPRLQRAATNRPDRRLPKTVFTKRPRTSSPSNRPSASRCAWNSIAARLREL